MDKRTCDIGVFGLGVMGRNFALNMADRGFGVGVFNRTEEKTQQFMEQSAEGRFVRAGYSLEEFVEILKRPRAVLISVPAGHPVDEVIDELALFLERGDLIIDSGNSHFRDTDRRSDSLAERGFLFMGMGISGGEYGARHGPSLMPGGPRDAYDRVRPVLEAAAAQVKGEPCVAYLGPGSAGHYVKMVHNGIEYGLMELIAEAYDLLRRGLGLRPEALKQVFEQWNQGRLNGYLVEITARILERKDSTTGKLLVDVIADRARQKGTGKWTSLEGLDLQVPAPTIDAAVVMRNLSDREEERRSARESLGGPEKNYDGDKEEFTGQLENALIAGFVVTYAQGMALLGEASRSHGYGLRLQSVAKIWRGGCIIRAALLEEFMKAYQERPSLENLLLSPLVGSKVADRQGDLRRIVCAGAELGIPVPGLASALGYYDAFRSSRLPANLIMAQRDYFGAHKYERTDAEGSFHTQWEN